MLMIRFYILLLSLLVLTGCAEDDKVLPEQRKQFETFLSKTHNPPLFTEQEAVESGEEVDFYSTMGESTYRYIANYYDPERQQRKEVEWGDTVDMIFWAYVFTNSAVTAATMPFLTNDATLRAKLEASGLNTEYWPFEQKVVRVGETPLIRGVEMSLPGCRERDTVEVYMTYNMAYGDALVNIIPEQSPIAYFFTIDKVRKK